MQVAPLHTPEEMREISNLAHIIEGVIIGVAATVALVETMRNAERESFGMIWPTLILAAGAFLFGYMVIPHHGLDHARDQWSFVLGDRQQRQHLILSFLVAIGGAAELWRRTRGPPRDWRLFVWPAVIAVAGLLFLIHPQHGAGESVARATLMHRGIGSVLLGAAALRAAAVWRPPSPRWLALGWPALLLVGAALLMTYREPEGAFAIDEHNTDASERSMNPR